ncbi:MAG: GTP cyclohydrolase I [Candidatus Hodgkinia cicadicola]
MFPNVTADVVYIPSSRLVDLPKVLTILSAASSGTASQETLTQRISLCLNLILRPKAILVRLTCRPESATSEESLTPSAVTEACDGLFRISAAKLDSAHQLLATRWI